MTPNNQQNEFLAAKAKAIRKEIFKFKTRTGNGHLASCLSTVDILVSLVYDGDTAFRAGIDHILFSKAHGSPAIYPILADLNIIPAEELNKYCVPGGILRLHSDQSIPGCYFVGGSLGNGLGYAAGRAYANRESRWYVIVGDAELYEGAIWESLMFIRQHNIPMTIIVDRNGMGILGETEKLLQLEPLQWKFSAFGLYSGICNGHNFDAMRSMFKGVPCGPYVVIANTIKGKGVSYMEGRYEYHTIIPKDPQQIEQGLQELS